MTHRIDQAFARARDEGRAAFVAYLCAGDPDFEGSLEACRAVLENGADVLELGVPFSDPLADGLTNQLAAQRALGGGANHASVCRLVRAIREFSDAPVVLYAYCNMVFSRGSDAYARDLRAAGADGLLTLDLPPEEAGEHLEACRGRDLRTVFIVAPTTPEERIGRICEAATGFVYYVSREGVTGEQATLAGDLDARVEAIRARTERPVAVGFGVSSPEHVRAVAGAADGVVVGSALVNRVAENAGDRAAMREALAGKMRELLADGALRG